MVPAVWLFLRLALLTPLSYYTDQALADDTLECNVTSDKYFNVNKWFYSKFTSLTQLNVLCDIMNNTEYFIEYSIYTIEFDFSSMESPFNESIDLSGFANFSDMSFFFRLHRIKGFDLGTSRPLIYLNQSAPWLNSDQIQMLFTDFSFYYKGSLVDADLCDTQTFENVDVKLFQNMANFKLSINLSCNLRRAICPYVFKNARIAYLQVEKVTNSRITQHPFRFLQIKNARNVTLNSTILIVYFAQMYQVGIDYELLDRRVFESLTAANFGGNLGRVTDDFFKTFKKIRHAVFIDVFLRDFFHSSTNEWLYYVFIEGQNFNSKQEMEDYLKINDSETFTLSFGESSSTYSYSFPEEDLCFFKRFPSQRAIATRLHYGNTEFLDRFTNASISSTVQLLLQNTALIESYRPYSYHTSYPLAQFDEFSVNETELHQKLIKCTYENYSSHDSVYFSYYNFVSVLGWLEFVGPVVTFPIVTAVAFLANLTIILVVTSRKNKKLKLFESKMFEYILLNSGINCIECFIYEFRLVSICLEENSIFCSTVRYAPFVKIFTVSVTGYLSEVLKTASILTGLLFSLIRYVETSKSESRALKALVSARIRTVSIAVIALSFLISVSKIFEYGTDAYGFDYPDRFRFDAVNSSDSVGLVFYMFHYVVNDLVLLFVNFYVDIRLVICIKKNLKQKYLAKMSTMDQEMIASDETSKLNEALKKKKSVENKANALIVSNIVIYFFCRLPELLSVFFFHFSYKIYFTDGYCGYRLLCYLMANVIEYLYMLSYLFTILVCYKFNSNFEAGLRNFFNLKERKH